LKFQFLPTRCIPPQHIKVHFEEKITTPRIKKTKAGAKEFCHHVGKGVADFEEQVSSLLVVKMLWLYEFNLS